jgi:hypothetical protein
MIRQGKVNFDQKKIGNPAEEWQRHKKRGLAGLVSCHLRLKTVTYQANNRGIGWPLSAMVKGRLLGL